MIGVKTQVISDIIDEITVQMIVGTYHIPPSVNEHGIVLNRQIFHKTQTINPKHIINTSKNHIIHRKHANGTPNKPNIMSITHTIIPTNGQNINPIQNAMTAIDKIKWLIMHGIGDTDEQIIPHGRMITIGVKIQMIRDIIAVMIEQMIVGINHSIPQNGHGSAPIAQNILIIHIITNSGMTQQSSMVTITQTKVSTHAAGTPKNSDIASTKHAITNTTKQISTHINKLINNSNKFIADGSIIIISFTSVQIATITDDPIAVNIALIRNGAVEAPT